MNRERVQALLEHLSNLPDEKFYYPAYFKRMDRRQLVGQSELVQMAAISNLPPPCNTAGCVAGCCALLFWEDYCKEFKSQSITNENNVDFYLPPDDFAGPFLGLHEADQNRLFMAAMTEANRQDAINRLEHLLAHETLKSYDWSSESYVTKTGVTP